MTKSTKTLKTLANVGRILSKIIFIFCIVGAAFCIVGILSLAIGVKSNVQVGDVNIHLYVVEKTQMSLNDLYTAMSVAIVSCVAEAVLAKISEKYFVRRLNGGTPFSDECAKDTLKFGIYTIVLPIISSIIASIVHGIMEVVLSDVTSASELNDGSSFLLGIMMIVLSVVFRAGEEQICAKTAEENDGEKTEVQEEDPFSDESK